MPEGGPFSTRRIQTANESENSGRTGCLLSMSRSRRHLGWCDTKDSVPSIPTGFRNKARGCVVSDATPGNMFFPAPNPNGVASGGRSKLLDEQTSPPHRLGHNPVGVASNWGPGSQGILRSSGNPGLRYVAPLGQTTQSFLKSSWLVDKIRHTSKFTNHHSSIINPSNQVFRTGRT